VAVPFEAEEGLSRAAGRRPLHSRLPEVVRLFVAISFFSRATANLAGVLSGPIGVIRGGCLALETAPAGVA
jgi:hypothetical protein